MKKIYLVDVSSMFFRAFYAIRPLNSPAGLPVNAIYGFLQMLTKLLRDEKPEYVVFCYDRKEPSFRKALYEEYKANRTEMPEDLAKQIPYIKRLADVLGIPSIEVPDYEADDLIGTLARMARDQDFEALIISGDKDFGQLVGDGIVLYDTMKEIKYDPAGVQEKWGIRPDQMIDYLALVGDSSDNIPGVTGIGPKGAIKLLEQFADVEDIYAKIDQVESKSVREKLIRSKDMAFLSKKLVTIVTDVPMSNEMQTYHVRPMDRAGLHELLQELNFRGLEKTLLAADEGQTFAGSLTARSPAMPPPEAPTAPALFAPELIVKDRPVRWMNPTTLVDALPDGVEVWGWQDERALFVATDHEIYAVEGELKEIGPALENKNLAWAGYNLKAFWHVIGADRPRAAWDGMLAAYAVQAGDRSDFKKTLQEHVGLTPPELAPPTEAMAVHEKLREVLTAKLAERQATAVYLELELPLAAVLLRMERRGIRIDKELLAEQSRDLEVEIAKTEKEVHELAGEAFNIGSPKQLGVVLFEKLGLATGKKNKTGYSTDNEVLEKIEHPIAAKALKWRELSKLKSTYVDALPLLCDADNRVHTHLNQALTATGRLSSDSPNLQNIPVRTERGKLVRKAFIAGPGLKLLSVDYSQIELRILAHISGDPGLTRAFKDDLDIHAATAAEVFGVPLTEVTGDQRRTAKAVNFGIAYGQGAHGLAEVLGLPRREAQEVITRYFEKFKGVREYIDSTMKTAHEKGYVETLFGRRRYIHELSSKTQMVRKFGERAAINAPIQGTASDLVKKAMIALAEQVPVPMLLQVHDELIFEGPEEELRTWTPKILQIMEGVASLSVPLKANYAIGSNWDEAH